MIRILSMETGGASAWDEVAEKSVVCLIYLVFWLGVLLLSFGSIKNLRLYLVTRNRLRKRVPRKKPKAIALVDSLALAAFHMEKGSRVFIPLSAGLAVLAAFICAGKVSVGTALLLTFMNGSLPWIVLKIKLEKVRSQGNEEGEWFMAELLGKYRIAGFNMDLCLESIVKGRKKKSVCYDQCENVLAAMRRSGGKDELFASGESFYYAIGSSWAGMLAYNLGQAIAEGSNVTAGLEDVISQLRECRKLMEQRKRMNGEAGRLVLFMVPFSYIITLVFASRFLGIGLRAFLGNQFTDPMALVFFFTIIFTFMVNLLIQSCLRVKAADF